MKTKEKIKKLLDEWKSAFEFIENCPDGIRDKCSTKMQSVLSGCICDLQEIYDEMEDEDE